MEDVKFFKIEIPISLHPRKQINGFDETGKAEHLLNPEGRGCVEPDGEYTSKGQLVFLHNQVVVLTKKVEQLEVFMKYLLNKGKNE